MIKKLVFIAVLIFITILAASFANTHSQTAVFKACPGTEYCSDLGRAQQTDPVHIRYKGWPFKVKVGNPDWCEHGVCEGNNFHPGYKGEFLIYNAAIISVPVIIAAGAYIYAYNRRLARRLAFGLGVIGVSLALGWFTMSTVRSHFIRAYSQPGISFYEPQAGFPLSTELTLGYGCYLDTSQEAIDCSRQAFQDTPFWHSDSQNYINWAFWTVVWIFIWLGMAAIEYKMRNHAHSRH